MTKTGRESNKGKTTPTRWKSLIDFPLVATIPIAITSAGGSRAQLVALKKLVPVFVRPSFFVFRAVASVVSVRVV